MGLLEEHIASFEKSSLAEYVGEMAVGDTVCVKGNCFSSFGQLSNEYKISGDVAVHASAVIEPGANIKGPAIIGPNCLIEAGAYVRDGCWLEGNRVLGPGVHISPRPRRHHGAPEHHFID